MAYWLIKSEPNVYSFDQLIKDKTTVWDGVRNYAARNNLRAMKKGEQAYFYHSNEGLAIVGIAKVSKEAFQDPGTENPNWVAIEIKAYKKLKRPVTLASMKANPKLINMGIIKIGRISVSQVSEEEWNEILQMSETPNA
ncbi:MAG: EVE domain-containing protein [Chitinophagaceae bacterium]|nr:EVE domain-containing protein [Bacteroidota bacterium]MCC6257307.1 EVE domain-containing protein [Chitinophagaceae bacterium]MCW5916686.1 EVE domain-containing protein [Ferruginibacter sp.]